ncbi:MAG: hypothetical protein JW924_00035 [Fusobacteriaceae bacterium]|nr:hypothetical protein [Fusobacteriaceae bacterium]
MSDDTWNSLETITGKNYDEIWKVNKAFLNKQITERKTIFLSNNLNEGYYFDNKTPRFYQREIDYLKEKGYKFEKTSDNLWKAIKK